MALAAAAVLVGYLLTWLVPSPLPFVVGAIVAVLAIALAFFREPAGPARWVARASGVLAGLAVVAFVSGLFLSTSGAAPWPGFALVALAALLTATSLLLGLGSAAAYVATRRRRA